LKYRIGTKEIALWNDLSVNQQLKVGQTLTLFVNSKTLLKKKSAGKAEAHQHSASPHTESARSDSSHKKPNHKKS
jgi:hypothetical protein